MNVVVIPAYNPDKQLLELVKELCERGIEEIIVVNDGSDSSSNAIFEETNCFAVVLEHTNNRGKGAAIKTALRYIAKNLEGVNGIVMLDADGQHRPEDAMRLLQNIQRHHNTLVLGVRSFKKNIPLRSLLGNTITKYVFRLCSGKWVSDTQTGLRAFSADLLPVLLQVQGERYEYEMNLLLAVAKGGITIKETPIKTIYHDQENTCSHFRTIRDSARIYGNLILFSGASFLSFLLDYVLFFPMVWIFEKVGIAAGTALIAGNIVTRLFSASFNYSLNSKFVFQSHSNRKKTVAGYAILAGSILTLNTLILFALHDIFGIQKAVAKLLTEVLLFMISFVVQRFVIFKKEKSDGIQIESRVRSSVKTARNSDICKESKIRNEIKSEKMKSENEIKLGKGMKSEKETKSEKEMKSKKEMKLGTELKLRKEMQVQSYEAY